MRTRRSSPGSSSTSASPRWRPWPRAASPSSSTRRASGRSSATAWTATAGPGWTSSSPTPGRWPATPRCATASPAARSSGPGRSRRRPSPPAGPRSEPAWASASAREGRAVDSGSGDVAVTDIIPEPQPSPACDWKEGAHGQRRGRPGGGAVTGPLGAARQPDPQGPEGQVQELGARVLVVDGESPAVPAGVRRGFHRPAARADLAGAGGGDRVHGGHGAAGVRAERALPRRRAPAGDRAAGVVLADADRLPGGAGAGAARAPPPVLGVHGQPDDGGGDCDAARALPVPVGGRGRRGAARPGDRRLRLLPQVAGGGVGGLAGAAGPRPGGVPPAGSRLRRGAVDA